MSAAIFEQRSAYIERLYRLLPGVYRSRDTAGELRAFLGLFADELLRLRANVNQQLADHFVDSCQDWMLPYLADLVGTDVLYADGVRNRVDVKNTIRWRRAKGTLAGLEDMTQGVSGWGAHAVEMLERVVWLQNLAHVKPEMLFCLDLRNRDVVAALNTPFSKTQLTRDLRPLALRASGAVGLARATNVAMHVWPIPSFPLQHVTPVAVNNGRFSFAALGFDQNLYAGGVSSETDSAAQIDNGADISAAHVDHVPLRIQDVRRHAAAYVNSEVGFCIREDGVPICSAAVSVGPTATPSVATLIEFAQFAQVQGMIAADQSLFGVTQVFTLAAVRLGAVMQMIGSALAPVEYSPGLPLADQLQLLNPHGTLQLDGATPNFSYTPGAMAYSPNSGEFHHPALLLRIANVGAAAGFPESEVVVRNERGMALQVFLPAIAALLAGQSLYIYVSTDGSAYFARGDHAVGLPDRNPDQGPYGAFALQHLARAAESQVRLTPGHPLGATRTRRAVIRALCCWDQPLEPPLISGQVAIDPERGRFMFPAGELPTGTLSVDYRFGLSWSVGAGPFDRGTLSIPTLTVALDRDAQHTSIQAAINAAPDGGATAVVIEILDSGTYVESLNIANRNFPGGLVIQASALQTPTIVKPAGPAFGMRVNNSTLSALTLDGLTFTAGDWQLQGAIDAITLNYCTLTPASVSIAMVAATTELSLRSSICGPIALTVGAGSAMVSDSVLQHPLATVEQPQGQFVLDIANMALTLDRCTLVGDMSAASASVANSLLYGDVSVADQAASCWRFSRLPAALHPPRAFRTTSATPIFISLKYGDAGYCHLHPNTSSALRSGGEEGGEIGAFHQAGIAWRLQNLARRLSEYTPAGVTSFVLPVLPRLAFRGNLPS